MTNKKHWLDKIDAKRNITIAFFTAIILFCAEALRFFISLLIKPLSLKEILAFFIPWSIAFIMIMLLLKGFLNNSE